MKKIIVTLVTIFLAQQAMAATVVCGLSRQVGNGQSYQMVSQVQVTIREGQGFFLKDPKSQKDIRVGQEKFYVGLSDGDLVISIAPNSSAITSALASGQAETKALSLLKSKLAMSCLIQK